MSEVPANTVLAGLVSSEANTIRKVTKSEQDITQNANALKTVFSPLNYGAKGDGSNDDTAAIQQAVDAANAVGGGIVYLPAGTFCISQTIQLHSNISVIGANEKTTIIKITSASAGHFEGVDISFVTIKNLSLIGLGMDSAGGGGIYFHRLNDDNIMGIYMENVLVNQCAGSGITISCPITSTFINVTCMGLVGDGFSFYQGGTSVTMISCYAITCTQAGFDFNQMNYCTLQSCAVEVCGIGFYLNHTCNNVNLIGCGAEDQIPRKTVDGVDYLGVDFQVEGGVGNSLIGCYSRNNTYAGIVLKSWGNTLVSNYRQIGSAQIGIQADDSCNPLLINNTCAGTVSATGQIGVLANKFAVEKLEEKIDLDTVQESGFYAYGYDNPATNGAVDNWFVLQVIKLADTNGIQIQFDTNTGTSYVRNWSNTAANFGAWQKMAIAS